MSLHRSRKSAILPSASRVKKDILAKEAPMRLLGLTASLLVGAACVSAQQTKAPRDLTADQVRARLPGGIRYLPDIAYDNRAEAQKLDLYLPAQGGSGRRPAIVFVHGGGWRNGDERRAQWWRMPAEYARDGYVAVSVNYRLAGEAPFPAQIEDVKCAVRWLRAHAKEYAVDDERIGAYGTPPVRTWWPCWDSSYLRTI